MRIIKEFCPASNRGVIRTNTYGSQLSMFLELAAIAKQDFPYLTEDNIEIVHYGGERYAKTFGIEFPAHGVPDDYQIISQLELTR